MKKAITILLLSVLLLGLGLSIKTLKETPKLNEKKFGNSNLLKTKTKPQPQLVELINSPIKTDIIGIPMHYDLLTPDCQKEWRDVIASDLVIFYQNLKQQYYSIDCFPALSNINLTHAEILTFLKECEANSDIEVQCWFITQLIRSQIIDGMYDNNNFHDLQDQVLFNKIFSQLFDLNKSPSNQLIQNIRAMSKELIVRHPSLLAPYKSLLLSYMIEEGRDLDQAQNILDRVHQLGIQDEDIFELEMIILRSQDPSNDTSALIKNYLIENPQDPLGHYWMADYYWRNKNRQLAVQELEIALQLKPGEKKYIEALDKARSSDFDSKIAFFEIHLFEN